jgi:hypothetical protein
MRSESKKQLTWFSKFNSTLAAVDAKEFARLITPDFSEMNTWPLSSQVNEVGVVRPLMATFATTQLNWSAANAATLKNRILLIYMC